MQEQILTARRIAEYRQWLTQRKIAELEKLAGQLKGKKIYEINATAIGGGVVELLQSQVPLMMGLGLDAHWLVLPPDERFFTITKQFHNALQGGRDDPPDDIEYYDEYTQQAAKTLPRDGDIYILHDPQTLGFIPFLAGKTVIWRCHIDLTNAEPRTLAWVRRRLRSVQTSIFSLQSYTAGMPKTAIVYPSIDPLAPKNQPMARAAAEKVLQRHGIKADLPIVTQISRYDRFKDPLGVLEICELVRRKIPQLQCVLLGNYATDDPEGSVVYEEVVQVAGDKPNTFLIVNAKDNDELVNALQSRADVVVQNSNREGFGLTVTEAMWKRALVCARPVGGIVLQVKNRRTGLYFNGSHEADAKILTRALETAGLRDRLGQAAHDIVERQFITPVMLADYLKVYAAAAT